MGGTTKAVPPTRDMNDRSGAVPQDAHHRMFDYLDESGRKALAFMRKIEVTSSSADTRYSKAVKPALIGRHMLGLDPHDNRVNRQAGPEGLKHLRLLAVHYIVYDAGEREGWRLTPFGHLVALCAPKPAEVG